MTPEEQYKLLRETSSEIEDAVEAAFAELIRRIESGDEPREAVAAVMASFTGEYAAIYAAGLSVVMGESIGAASALSIPVGEIPLSARLYAQSQATSSAVQGVVQRHVQGFQQARALALDLFEGYDFREREELNLRKGNPELPRHMRDALLDDPRITRGLKRAYAKLEVENLTTPELRAAYRQLLQEIDAIEAGSGGKHLNKKLRVAFYERMRYYAKRIADTELHRNYAQQQAREYMQDDAVQFVQWRLSPMHPIEDICDYFAGLDRYGLGPGVYPKALAPVAPAHPHCKCVLSPRLDLTGREPSQVEDAEERFFARYGQDTQRRIAGSQAKLERIRAGSTAWEVHNAGVLPIYQVRPASQV